MEESTEKSADFFGRKDMFFTCDQIIQVSSTCLLSHTLLSMKGGKNDFFKVSKKAAAHAGCI